LPISALSPFFNWASSAATIAPVLAVFLGLRLVAADDVALALDHDLLDEELRLARLALTAEGRSSFILQHDLAHDGSERSRAQEYIRACAPPALDRRREIMPRSATTQTRPMEKRWRSRSITQQRGDVGGIARPHLGANWSPISIDDQRQDHLLQIGVIVLE